MCGIAGWIDFGVSMKEQEKICTAMSQTLSRRGPDDSGVYLDTHAALLHRRLAVIDPENGRQPMSKTVGETQYVLIYNGELYNTEELRQELLARGHRFTGHSDTEVLLCAYIEWGEDCLPRLNGIFAFGVYSSREQKLFLARDRMGVKPLFYHQTPQGLIFGSEIKTLLAHPSITPTVDAQGVGEIFLIGPGRTPGHTPFRDILELEPGCCGFFSREGFHIKPYWKLEAAEHRDTLEQTREKINWLVSDSIRRQMVSDVPIASLLSGGLDSSIISAVSAQLFEQEGRGPLTTYSVDYIENDKYFKANAFQQTSDSHFIEIMQNFIGSRHQNIVLDHMDVAEALGEAVSARDLPGMADVDSSLLLFCRAIKKEHTVAVSGECADEIFGGYPWYRNPAVRDKADFPWSGNTRLKSGLLRPGLLPFDPEEYVLERYRDTVEKTPKLAGESREDARIREISMLNFRWFMQTLLDRKDRMSMFSGLEVRVPFCDHRIVEYAYNIPWQMKSLGDREKGLLRSAFEKELPHEIIHRKKSPYPKTHNPAYLARVKEMLTAVLEEPNSPLLELVSAAQLRELLESDAAAFTVPWYGQLMNAPQIFAYFYQINCWMKEYKVQLAL
ncbi:asparagine synthase (glutamine-hydrolyzing) [Oscillospiraceae bacterium MB08-C2-2]|nr:asparagine synthase (glutamine-hydrolyzing) [Oscillospiraceae bacterium MB08-C2-2]